MSRENLEVVINVCWRIVDRYDADMNDFIAKLNQDIPEFKFISDGQNSIIVLGL